MSSKKLAKIGSALLIVATIITAFSMVFADAGVRIPDGSDVATGSIAGPVGNILGIVQYICYAAAVILLIMLGVKYMTSAPDAKAEVKKMALYYVIGAVAVFAAGLICRIIVSTAAAAL